MVPAKETAEEQLLRMIEGPSGPLPPKATAKPFSIGKLVEPFLRGGGFPGFGPRPQPRKDRNDPFLSRLQLTGRLFWVLLGGLGLYLVADLWLLQPTPPTLRPVGGGSSAAPAGPLTQTLDEQLRQSAEYRSTLASRNPFRLDTGRLAESDATPTVKNRLLEMTSTLTVVGINRSRVPEALIEDTEAKRTHFVKVGDTVNGMTITAIDDRGVTLKYEGEETILQ